MKIWGNIKAVIRPVGKFLHDAGAVAFGESIVKEAGKATVDQVKEVVLDAEGKRSQLFERLLAIRPSGKNIIAWHGKTNASLKPEQRLVVDGKRIAEYRFVNLLASWTPKTHPRKIDDFLRLIDTLTEQEFCNYLALKWNNVLSQQFTNTFSWLRKNREVLADDEKVESLLSKAKRKTKEVVKKTGEVATQQADVFEQNIRQKTEWIKMDNYIQGDL